VEQQPGAIVDRKILADYGLKSELPHGIVTGHMSHFTS
jgi:hypothetical protein